MRYGAAICVGIRRSLAKAPRLVDHEIEPFTVDEAQLLLKTAMDRRNGVRWAIALALGLRQVEARPQVVRCRLGGGKSDGSTPTGAPSNLGRITPIGSGFCRRPVFAMHVCTTQDIPRQPCC